MTVKAVDLPLIRRVVDKAQTVGDHGCGEFASDGIQTGRDRHGEVFLAVGHVRNDNALDLWWYALWRYKACDACQHERYFAVFEIECVLNQYL